MQISIRVPLTFTLLFVCFQSIAIGQINSGYFPGSAPISAVEPFYDPGGLTVGCYRDPGPCWLGQATFDVLLLDRSAADARTIATEIGTGNPLLNTSDLSFPITAGFRFNLVLPSDNGCDFVFNYLGAKFDNSRVNNAATAQYDYFDFPAITPTGVTSFETSYTSTLSSIEFNGRYRRWSHFAPIIGLRFIEVEDQFDRMSADSLTELQNSMTDNEMWGLQIGGEGLLWDTGPVRLQSTVKGGIFYNDVELQTGGTEITTGLTTFDPTGRFTGDHASFFGEVNLELAYFIGPHFSIRAGYTVMWLDGVAFAPDQHDDFNLQTGIGSFDFGSTMYHGSYIGAELTW